MEGDVNGQLATGNQRLVVGQLPIANCNSFFYAPTSLQSKNSPIFEKNFENYN